MNGHTDWHQLFALMMHEVFSGTAAEIEREVELAVKASRIDVIVAAARRDVRPRPARRDAGAPRRAQPDLVQVAP